MYAYLNSFHSCSWHGICIYIRQHGVVDPRWRNWRFRLHSEVIVVDKFIPLALVVTEIAGLVNICICGKLRVDVVAVMWLCPMVVTCRCVFFIFTYVLSYYIWRLYRVNLSGRV